jgi:two-component system, cell cycle response regulator
MGTVKMTTTPANYDSTPMVLIIDDSPEVHRLLRARLRHEEISLVSAYSGAEGVSTAAAKIPALVLLDLDMADMDGFEVLRRLKEQSCTLEIPVIVLSGLHGAQDKVSAFDLGAVDYITKPFNLTELRVRVRSALRLHRLVQMLAQRAHIDGLTGLWNRAHFDKRWSDEVAECTRHGRALSLAMMDVDHFKAVNDIFGHPAGDAVLQGLAKVFERECRREDIACRYGGEEFAMIMPETGPDDAARVCERIRLALRETVWARHPDRRISLSIGIAGAMRGGSVAAEKWLEVADRALYSAKQAGRDAMMVANLDPDVRLARAG